MSSILSRRFRFSLQALLVAVTLAGVAAWWTSKYLQARHAEAAYDRTFAEWRAETVTTDELCQRSQDWLDAELGVPFADHAAAKILHQKRIALIQVIVEATKLLRSSGEVDLKSARARWQQERAAAAPLLGESE